MEQYLSAFVDAGFVSMADFAHIHFADLVAMHIPVWDPAGQERYAPITKTFFRRAHGAAIVFAANEPCTWKHVEYWMRELETNAPDDIEVMLVCNKADLLA